MRSIFPVILKTEHSATLQQLRLIRPYLNDVMAECGVVKPVKVLRRNDREYQHEKNKSTDLAQNTDLKNAKQLQVKYKISPSFRNTRSV